MSGEETITLRQIVKADLGTILLWHNELDSLNWISPPSDDWFVYVTTNPDVRCWIAESQAGLIGLVQVDRVESIGHIDIMVDPAMRGRGMGKRVLRTFISQCSEDYLAIEGHIDPKNLRSIACFRAAEFDISKEVDQDGLYTASYNSAK